MPRIRRPFELEDMEPEEKALPVPKGAGKMKDEMDEELEAIETGKKKPSTLSDARKAFAGTKMKRPRFGGFGVSQ